MALAPSKPAAGADAVIEQVLDAVDAATFRVRRMHGVHARPTTVRPAPAKADILETMDDTRVEVDPLVRKLVGGMMVTSMLHTALVGSILIRLAIEGPGGLAPRDLWDWVSLAILVSGYVGAFAIQVSGLIQQRAFRLLPMQALLPAYWFLHSFASLRAAWELIVKPVYWAKTTHGVTRVTRGATSTLGERRLKPRTG